MDTPGPSSLEALSAAVARGRRDAFAALYAATSPQLFGVALRILKRRDWAEEALQDSYVSVWRRAGDYRPVKGSVLTWMVSIVRYRAIDVLRRNRMTVPLEETPERETWRDPGPSPFEATLASAEGRRLRACLETLDDKPRAAIMLAYFEGLTHEELATRLAAPLGTVKSWIRRALAKLKDCLGS